MAFYPPNSGGSWNGGTVENPIIIDVTNTEAFLVRQNGDTGDIFRVDTSTPLIDCNARIDLDAAIADGATTTIGLDSLLTVTTTGSNATLYRGGSIAVVFSSAQTLSTDYALMGCIFQANVSGGGTAAKVTGADSVVVAQNASTINEGYGFVLAAFKVDTSTFASYFGLKFIDSGFAPTTSFAFDFEAPYISNSRSVRVRHVATTKYMPLSTADTGITLDATTLTLATTTSGNVALSAASNLYTIGGGAGNPRVLVRSAAGGDSSMELGESSSTTLEMKADGGFDQFTILSAATTGRQFVFGDYANGAGRDYDHAAQTNPTIFVHSAANPDTDNTEFATFAYDRMGITGTKGSYFTIKTITELVTVPVGQGIAGVASATNLAPADSLIFGVGARITQAPGGGATLLSIGVTLGLPAALIQDMDTTVNNTAVTPSQNDGEKMPLLNGTATTLTLTTDADVTGSDMIVRVVVYYAEFVAPTS